MADDVNKNHDMILGEMRGQMREVVHTLNNLSSKFDALTREVVALDDPSQDQERKIGGQLQ